MKWSWTVGKFWGTELRLHISLLLLIPYAMLTFQPANAGDFLRVMLLIVGVFACVTLHEAGHTLAARLYGIEVKNITLWPLGGFASLSRRPEEIFPNLVIVAAGPLTNFILAVGFILIGLVDRLLLRSAIMPELPDWLNQVDFFPFIVGLVIANLSLALFNLVPIYPLDGGQIARDLLKLIFGEKNGDRILVFISFPLVLGVCLLGLLTKDIILMLTGSILLLSSMSLNAQLSSMISSGLMYLIDRGGYYLRKEDYDRAVQEYSRAIQQRPGQAGLYLNRGIAYLSMMEYGPAREDLEHALKIDPNHYAALTMRGELFDLEGQPDQALVCYDRAIQGQPGWAIPYADRGSLYQKTGNLKQASADLDQAVALGQGMAVAYVLRSILRYQMGELAASFEDMERAMRQAPQWMLVFPEVFLENFKGHVDWVLEYYNRAVQRFPGAYQAYQGRADALRVNGRLNWAINDYQRSIQLAPKRAVLYLNRGLTFQRLGISTRAAEDYRAAIDLADQPYIRERARRALLNA